MKTYDEGKAAYADTINNYDGRTVWPMRMVLHDPYGQPTVTVEWIDTLEGSLGMIMTAWDTDVVNVQVSPMGSDIRAPWYVSIERVK